MAYEVVWELVYEIGVEIIRRVRKLAVVNVIKDKTYNGRRMLSAG